MFKPIVEKIRDIIERRLIRVDEESRRTFPSVLQSQPTHWISFADEKIFSLFFVTEEEIKRINSFQEKRLNPFPGLVTTDSNLPSAFAFSGSRFGSIIGSTVKNSNSFFAGPDTSFFVADHSQSLNTIEEGEVTYKILLAYFLSFGVEVTPDNVYQNLEELIVYSIKVWRKSHG